MKIDTNPNKWVMLWSEKFDGNDEAYFVYLPNGFEDWDDMCDKFVTAFQKLRFKNIHNPTDYFISLNGIEFDLLDEALEYNPNLFSKYITIDAGAFDEQNIFEEALKSVADKPQFHIVDEDFNDIYDNFISQIESPGWVIVSNDEKIWFIWAKNPSEFSSECSSVVPSAAIGKVPGFVVYDKWPYSPLDLAWNQMRHVNCFHHGISFEKEYDSKAIFAMANNETIFVHDENGNDISTKSKFESFCVIMCHMFRWYRELWKFLLRKPSVRIVQM